MISLLQPIIIFRWSRLALYGGVLACALIGTIVILQQKNRAKDADVVASSATIQTNLVAKTVAALQKMKETITEAQALGIDTTTAEKNLAQVKAYIANGQFSLAFSLTSTTSLQAEITAKNALLALDESEKAKYGSITITTIAGASLTPILNGVSGTGVTANDQGTATFNLLIGSYTFLIEKAGYASVTTESVEIKSKENSTLAATISPSPTPTPSATATATAKPTSTPTTTPTTSASSSASDSTTYSSYERRTITTSRGSFVTDLTTFQLGPGKVKVITDTAADAECATDCPVMSVKSYADRYSGAIAAINGTYFCPTDYSTCHPDEVNAFFWKIANQRVGKMINQWNTLAEFDPFLTFSSNGTATWYNTWDSAPRDVFAGINHKPAVVKNGSYSVDEGALDTKQRTAKISRAALGLTGQTLMVAIVQSATIMDLGSVMENLGVTNALNIDAGGSSALWYNGSYKRGPGRGVPNALVFIEQ